MKKIISMLALAISAFAIVACSDDDNVGSQYQKKSNIVITASNLNFSAKADTGSVTFTAPEAATVRLNSAWATAVLEGNKVKVTVKENNNVEGRATQLTILCGTDSANVTIQQLGMNYEYNGHHLFIYNDEAHAVSYPVVNEGANITLSSSADWAVPTLNNNQVDVALAANNDGHIRLAELYIEAGPYKDTIQVLQGQLKDVVGKQFRFIGYDLAQATSTTHDIRELYAELQTKIVTDAQGKPFIEFTDADKGWLLPIDFNEETLSFDVNAGELMGMYYHRYYIYSSIIDFSYYQKFQQNNLLPYFSYPGIHLSMTAVLGYDKQAGTFAQFFDNEYNDAMIQQLTDNKKATYNANVFAATVFQNKWDLEHHVSPKRTGDLILYLQPMMIEGTVGSGAKRALPEPVRQQRISPYLLRKPDYKFPTVKPRF